MHAAHAVNGPRFAHALLTTVERLAFLPWGYDERQFCSVGLNLPVGRLTRTPNGEFYEGDIERLPWLDDSFDVVTGFNAFQYAANLWAAELTMLEKTLLEHLNERLPRERQARSLKFTAASSGARFRNRAG